MARPPLRVGMLTMQHPPWTGLLDRCRRYEALGFDGVWLCDHVVGQQGEPLLDAWTALAALMAGTERTRLGVLVSCMAFRSPALLAAQAIGLARIGPGRLELGLGAGWWGAEHRAFGLPFPPGPARVARFRSYVETVVGHLQAGEGGVGSPPSRPPLVLAAHGPRMLEMVARHADAWVGSFGLSATEVAERNRLLDARCAAAGRDPDAVRRIFCWAPWVQAEDPWDSPAAFVAFLARYREAGVDEFVLDEPRPEQRPTLERVARDVLPALRAGETAFRQSRRAGG